MEWKSRQKTGRFLYACFLLCALSLLGAHQLYAQSQPDAAPPEDDVQRANFTRLQLVGKNPLDIKVFEDIDPHGDSARNIVSATIQKFYDKHGYWPQLVVASEDSPGLNTFIHEVARQSNAGRTDGELQTRAINLDKVLTPEILEHYRQGLWRSYDLTGEIASRTDRIHPSQHRFKDRMPTRREVVVGMSNGFAMATISTTIWYMSTGNLRSALLIGSLLVLERAVSFSMRPLFDWIKRFPDGFLAQHIKYMIPWLGSSIAWKIGVDVIMGMMLVQLPRLLTGVYSGTDFAIGTSYVIWRLLHQCFLHSASDPFGIAKVFREGAGTISRRATNMITYVKPYITNTLTLFRILGSVSADLITTAMVSIGAFALLVKWEYAFYVFGGGQIVIGPDLRHKYISRKNSFGIRYVAEPPTNRYAGQSRFSLQPFFGYEVRHGKNETYLKFDTHRLLIDPNRLDVFERTSQGLERVFDDTRKLDVLNAMTANDVARAQQPAYRIEGDEVHVRHDGTTYIVKLVFDAGVQPTSARVGDDGGIGATRGRVTPAPLNELETRLIDALWATKNFRLTDVRAVRTPEGDTRFAVEVDGFEIHQRFNYLFYKDGRFSTLPKKASAYVDYAIKTNESMGRNLTLVAGDAPFIKRFSLVTKLMFKKAGQWAMAGLRAPFTIAQAIFKKYRCE